MRALALAIFDIDGTLVSGPSLEKRLFALLFRRGRLTPSRLLAFGRFGARHAPQFGRQTMKKNKAYLAGLACADVASLVAEWIRSASPGWWYPPALARLRQHQAAGDPVVLMSGTPQFVAEALARELGVSRVVATCCAAEAGRFLPDPPLRHPFGPEKRALALALCAEFRVETAALFAYADSVHDLPLLEIAGHPVAVRPDAGLRSAALAGGWEILGRR